MKSNTYTQTKKVMFDWTNKTKSLKNLRMLKFYARHGMLSDKVREIIVFKQSGCSEKYISFNTQ